MNDRLILPDAATFAERIELLRGAMARETLAAVLIPSADPHLSEYLPERWQGRQWLSGFTGSVGTLVVTARLRGRVGRQPLLDAGRSATRRHRHRADEDDGAASRPRRTSTGLRRTWRRARRSPSTAPCSASRRRARCGRADGARHRAAHGSRFARCRLARRGRACRTASVYEHAAPHASVSRADKLAEVRRAMQEKGAQWHFVSTLDDLAWLFNLRGADVSYNPVFVAHALIGLDDAALFVADGKVPASLRPRCGRWRAGRVLCDAGRRARRVARRLCLADRPAPHHVRLARKGAVERSRSSRR